MRIALRFHECLAYLAVAAGAGVALAAAAQADAIEDAWPYGGLTLPNVPPQLPGFLEPGSVTNSGRDQFGPITNSYADYVATQTNGGTDQWYSVHSNTFIVPSFYQDDHEVVTALLDGSATYPSAGTVWDQSVLFPIYNPAFGTINLFENTYVDDPKLGFADQFSVPAMSNVFLSDAAGMKDVFSAFGQSFTLLDLPLAASGADGSDLF